MNSITKIFDDTIKTDHKIITEEAAKSILKKYRVSVPGFSLATSADQAVRDATVSYTHLTLPTILLV